MSFGGFGGFGQSGQQQQQQPQQNTGFGGFGGAANTGSGFGSQGTTAFGSSNTATTGGLFGSGGGTSGGFGASGGFGSTGGAFGAKPGGFGTATTTSGSSLFGNTTATAGSTGFGGFGATPAATSSPFGGSSAGGGGLFGGQKSGFGTTTQSSPFGGGATTSSPFGGGGSSAFGAPASSALGGATGECQGTGSVPFQPFIEKEPNSTSNQQNSFQSISFQQPYQKFSPEELRLADYAQGRRYGNSNGQAGAFGTSNFGGGFGTASSQGGGFGTPAAASGSGLFGGGTTGSSFGASQPAQTGGFGSTAPSAGGGLFGSAPKPAGGLFGSTPAQPSGGGLFGSTNTGFGGTSTAGGAFGQSSTSGTTSLFGGGAAKQPFSFGTSQPASTGTGFGGGAPATSGGFGSGGGLFGNTGQQQNTGFGQQQQAPASNTFGGFGAQPAGGSSLFGGSAQPKPSGGLFGAAPAAGGGTGLFGNQPQNTTTGTNPFGTSTNNTAGSSLFGAAKPATGGLFGNTTANNQTTSTGGGLFGGSFGNTQNQNQGQQQSTGGGLFGSLNNTQPKTSLFGNPAPQQGGGLFGSSAAPQQGGGLFGGSQQQPQQQSQGSLFGGNSLFGGSQQGQQTPQSLTTSIGDNAAFGSASLFSNLAAAQVNNPGPIATPLSNNVNKQKKAAAIPIARLSSASSNRFATPIKRGGYGFSYSNNNTPSSVSSTASTPGTFSSSALGTYGGFGRTLSKSVSTSSLRNSFTASDSILAPGAFSASPSIRQFGSTGSVKKLNIHRGLRNDLFSPPNPQSSVVGSPAKKRVSFDAHTTINGTSSPLKVARANGESSREEQGLLPAPPVINGSKPKSLSLTAQPEMQQVKNNELAIVPEEGTTGASTAHKGPAGGDPKPGDYWMKPSKQEIENMNHSQRQKVSGFTVGRHSVGQVQFGPPVDLTAINLNDIFGKIVILETRNATVYPNAAQKPIMGQGLNVPSTIVIENSWPRQASARQRGSTAAFRMQKHLERLRSVKDTEFVNYDRDSGIWTFKVEHFTTYGFPEDDQSDDEGMSEFDQSTLSLPPESPTPNGRTSKSPRHADQSFASNSQLSRSDSDPEDTFDFKRKSVLPGAFDEQQIYDDMKMDDVDEEDQQSFLDERSVGSQSENGVEEPMDQDDATQDNESVSILDEEMAGSYPEAGNTAELDEDSQDDEDMRLMDNGASVRARMRAAKASDTPKKFEVENDWTSALLTTVSPKKHDRALLKSLIDVNGNESRLDDATATVPKRLVSDGRGFANSIDLMNSLFGQARSPTKLTKVPSKKNGFEWPYNKRDKTRNEESDMVEADRAFHDSMKPSWGPDGTLVYAAPPNPKSFGRSSRRAGEKDGLVNIQKGAVVSESRDVRFAKFSKEDAGSLIQKQKTITWIRNDTGVPYASLPSHFSFSEFLNGPQMNNSASSHEKLVWQLASILFDEIEVPGELEGFPDAANRIRKDNLSRFWEKLVDDASSKNLALARSIEEKAIAALSGHKIRDACAQLVNGKDLYLATLVALIGTKQSVRRDMREQLNDWQKSRVLPEFEQPIRAIYELLSGNVCACEGSKGAPEDRMESFIISKRFGLDWRQAFGLRLWYGISTQDSIERAIESFADDLAQEKETARPHAWYVEQRVPTLWQDEELEDREDLLWGLMKFYTFEDADLESILRPENSQLSPLDVRLTWQLGQALISSGITHSGENRDEKPDHTTISFASQLTNEGSWLDAVFVLLHLSSEEARAKSIQNQLARHASQIGAEDSQSFKTLTFTYMIPTAWIWEAKALYMRSVEKDPIKEVECLIKAGSYNEAHRTFTRSVAPKIVIENDYDILQEILDGFLGQQDSIYEWHLGGQIYQDFLELLNCQKKAKAVDPKLLNRLLAGLPAVSAEARHPSFIEKVAVETMSGIVAKNVVAMGKKGEKSDIHKVLHLPLTEDTYLKHTIELSLAYYRNVVSGAKSGKVH